MVLYKQFNKQAKGDEAYAGLAEVMGVMKNKQKQARKEWPTMKKYQASPYLRTVSAPELGVAMVYHALYGNPRIVNEEGLWFLDIFKEPVTMAEAAERCDRDPSDVAEEFREIFFLVEPSVNEKEFLFQKRAQGLARVANKETVDRMGLAISDSCNLGCGHCIHFQSESNNGASLPMYQKPANQLNMSWETAKQCVDRYVKLMREGGKTLCKIHFGNAEPLINWSVIEKVLHYSESIEGMEFEFAINTNLVLMNREIAETFKKYRVRIATSLDGTAHANDAIRTTKNGRGTFESIIAKFDLLVEIGYPLDGFSITVTSGNFNLVDTDIIDLAAGRGMTSIAFDYDLVSLIDIPVKTRVEKLMRIKRYADERGIAFFGTWDSPFRNITSESLLTGDHAFCAAV